MVGAAPALASTGAPQARVQPAKVAIRGKATVIASHLPPGALVTLLLAVPDLPRHRVERLLGATHADARGNMRVTVFIPIITTCGAASLYLVSAQTGQHLRARLTVTGCKAGKKGGAPPPPPSHKP
jgi:hypothetical protein